MYNKQRQSEADRVTTAKAATLAIGPAVGAVPRRRVETEDRGSCGGGRSWRGRLQLRSSKGFGVGWWWRQATAGEERPGGCKRR